MNSRTLAQKTGNFGHSLCGAFSVQLLLQDPTTSPVANSLPAFALKRWGKSGRSTRRKFEEMIQSYVQQHGRITRQEAVQLCRLTPDQAYKLLKRLCEQNVLYKQGDRKAAVYFRC